MKEKLEKLDESKYSENDTPVKSEEKALIFLKSKAKKNLDETISTPDRYVSYFHYNTQNLDKYLELCPHCKKPALSAFRRIVIDSAIDYLENKRVIKDYSTNHRGFLTLITFLAAVGTVIGFLLIYGIPGLRI